jgi:hypothetical protein
MLHNAPTPIAMAEGIIIVFGIVPWKGWYQGRNDKVDICHNRAEDANHCQLWSRDAHTSEEVDEKGHHAEVCDGNTSVEHGAFKDGNLGEMSLT